MKVCILGAGTWGTTLAWLLAKKKFRISLWGRSEAVVREVNSSRINSRYLGQTPLSESIHATTRLEEAAADAGLIIVAVATPGLRELIRSLQPLAIPSSTPFLSVSKGIEDQTYYTVTEILREHFPSHPLAALSGPNIAKEILRGLPTSSVIASENMAVAGALQKIFNSPDFRVYTNRDLTGVEVAGALKNIMAIAAGVAEGLQLGENAKAALITRSLAEIGRMVRFKGGDPRTLMGLAGIGDLMVTCYSPFSRNHRVGLQLAEGKPLSLILKELGSVAEGVSTVQSIYHLSLSEKIEMPITEQVYQIIHRGRSPREALKNLMSRELKEEVI